MTGPRPTGFGGAMKPLGNEGVHLSRSANDAEVGWRHARASPCGPMEFGWRHVCSEQAPSGPRRLAGVKHSRVSAGHEGRLHPYGQGKRGFLTEDRERYMCCLRIVGPPHSIFSDDREAEARRSVYCAPENGARLKCLAPRLRPGKANVYIVICENAARLRPREKERAQS